MPVLRMASNGPDLGVSLASLVQPLFVTRVREQGLCVQERPQGSLTRDLYRTPSCSHIANSAKDDQADIPVRLPAVASLRCSTKR